VFCGEVGGGGAGVQAQLVVDGVKVPVHGVRAYEEFSGYVGVGQAAGDEFEDLCFSDAEAGGKGCGRQGGIVPLMLCCSIF
jgi:hypothetical protein